MSEDELDDLLTSPRQTLSPEVARIRAWMLGHASRVEGLVDVRPREGWLGKIQEHDGRMCLVLGTEAFREVLGELMYGKDIPDLAPLASASEDGATTFVPVELLLRRRHRIT